jgi:short-subunit dehydrogenase
MGVYNVSKHAVVALSESLYQDLKLVDAVIGASVLCPYFVPTGISQSHRNRPGDMQNQGTPTASQRAAQMMSAKAVNSGKVTAAEVAQRTFDAIRDEQFYIFSHPEALGNVQTRMEDIVNRRNPSDPYAATPHVREKLKNALQS